jgi:hypothetical protein
LRRDPRDCFPEDQTADQEHPMARKADLEAREADCRTASDLIALAREALAEPADRDYARELLARAELQCQFPADHIALAEAYARGLDDADYAREIFQQAEDACFEPAEFAALAHSLASVLQAKDTARALLEKAAAEAKQPAELLVLSRYAQQDLEDEAFAKELLARVENQCKSVEDFRRLAEGLLESDREAALALYRKGARYCADLPATAAYAEGALALFGDTEWARRILDEAETECQFTKDFVQLAEAYQRVLNDTERAGAALQQGAEFAMAGDEYQELARGHLLLGQREAAAEAYGKALKEISDRAELIVLATALATEVGDAALAREAYRKAEGKASSAADAAAIARAVLEGLQDRALAGEIYDRASARFTGPADQSMLAGELLETL